ncbi:hypothetical protein BGZ98_002376 [Dissophora globulifera]|nr:hypothetical protein BGZ98_002376 [Dissophora globulifera]
MGNEDGWASPKTLPILAAGILLLIAFVYIESKIEYPIMPFRVWTRRFSTSVITAFMLMGMMQGFIFYASMVFQEVYEWSALKTALGFLVHALLAIVVFTVLGRTLHRLSLKPMILAGFVFRCGAALSFAFVTPQTSYWRLPFPGLILNVFGAGFSMLPNQITAVRDADNKDQGLVGAIYNTGLQLGAPFGLAILNTIAISTNGQQGGAGAGISGGPELMVGYKNALFGIVAFGVFGFILIAIIQPWDRPARASKPVTDKNKDLESLQDETTIEAFGDKEEVRGEKESELAEVEAFSLDADLAGIPPALSEDAGDDSTIASRKEKV